MTTPKTRPWWRTYSLASYLLYATCLAAAVAALTGYRSWANALAVLGIGIGVATAACGFLAIRQRDQLTRRR